MTISIVFLERSVDQSEGVELPACGVFRDINRDLSTRVHHEMMMRVSECLFFLIDYQALSFITSSVSFNAFFMVSAITASSHVFVPGLQFGGSVPCHLPKFTLQRCAAEL